MKTPISYCGVKRTLAKTIPALMPEHRLYRDPFTGGGAVFFAKKPAEVEIINDINGELVNFYQVRRMFLNRRRRKHDPSSLIRKSKPAGRPRKAGRR